MNPSARPDIIEVQGLTKVYGRPGEQAVTALADVSLRIAEGEFISVVGPSGCGKTTLLRILAGLVTQYQGRASIRGKPLAGPSRSVGVAFQDANLLPWRNVLDNIILPAQVLGLDLTASKARAARLLELIGLTGFERKLPHELSGGMRQRVSIARSLLHDPEILLMDEPFGALDAITRDHMNVELRRIWRASGKTVFLITHSISEAVYLSSRVFVMCSRPGRIVRELAIDLPEDRDAGIMADPRFGAYAGELRQALDHPAPAPAAMRSAA